jgi:hypothetical protein
LIRNLKIGCPVFVKPIRWLTAAIVLFLLLFQPFSIESRANVRPAILEAKTSPVTLFNSVSSAFRNFSANSESPDHPAFPVLPVKKAQSDQEEDRCIFKESFRIYADRGQDPAQFGFTGNFIGYPPASESITYCLPFLNILTNSRSSFKIRPPPAF